MAQQPRKQARQAAEVEARLRLGAERYRQGLLEEALAAWREALARDPRCVPALLNIGKVLYEQKRTTQALAAYEQAAVLAPRAVPAHRALSLIYLDLERLEESERACRAVLALQPDHPSASATLGGILDRTGRAREAYELLAPLARQASLPQKELHAVAANFGNACSHLEPPSDQAFAVLQRDLARPDLPLDERKETLWILVGLADALGRRDEAFGWLEQAKALIPRDAPQGRRADARRIIEAAIASYTPERLARLPRAAHGSDLPVFIVGMPRSGTTLAEQIIGAHPAAFAAGELRLIPRLAVEALPREAPYPACLDALTQERADALALSYLDALRGLAPGARRIVDKMMFNFEHLGLIEILFPRARVVHCVRDPLDTCLSTYMRDIGNLAENRDMASLGRYYRRYAGLMERWQRVLKIPILPLRYETLIEAPERTMRELIAFCGLPWDDACLRFHEHKRFVRTHSYHQVQQPLYAGSIGRHREYEKYLAPLRAALEGAGEPAPEGIEAAGEVAVSPPEMPAAAGDEERPAPEREAAPALSAGAKRRFDAALGLRGAGRLEEAEAEFERLLAEHPEFPEPLLALAETALQKGRFARAAELCARALEAGARPAAAHFLRARALAELGEREAAIAAYRHAIAAQPKLLQAYNNLGNLLSAEGRLDEAIASFRQAVAVKPDYALAWYNLGNALRRRERLAEAIEAYRRALRAKPDYPEVLNNLGNALKEADRLEEAAARLERAVALRPGFAEALNNLGVVLKELNRNDESIRAYRAALAVAPGLADARFGLSLLLLLKGEYLEGWQAYEARWNSIEFPAVHRKLPEPLWDGESFPGRTLLLHFEQGYGDSLQLLRYVPLAAGRGGRIVLEVQRPLLRLAARFGDVAQVIANGDPRPPYDLQCPLLSLPFAFRTTLDNIPARLPYLHADPRLVEEWRGRLGGGGALKVGLVWAGNPRQKSEPKRGIGLEPCLPLLRVDGVRWYSLQAGKRAADAARLAPGALTDLSPQLSDFAETAAAIANLDLVVTTDTAVAHLSGALARPTWVMLRWSPDWRWHLGRDDNPWYPGCMRLFRQPRRDDWPAVVANVKSALEALVAARRAR